jgi:formylglycine-generating enzyme required for sulfatase activity
MESKPSYFKGEDRPVETVSWEAVQEFIGKLNTRAGCRGCYRLPTEAEWEYAARAGTTSAYSFGNDASQLNRYGWFNENSESQTHPVGGKLPNGWGLYDILWNVWEWVQDWYGEYEPGAQTDPEGPGTGSLRVFRGGGWDRTPRYLRSAGRRDSAPGYRNNSLGFRLLRTIP